MILHEPSTSIYSVRGTDLRWENSNENHLKMGPKASHMEGVTSLGRCDLFPFFS